MVTASIPYGYSLYSVWLQPLFHMVTASIPYGYSLYSIWLQPLYYGLLGGGHVAEQLEARRQIDEELGAGDACVHRLAGWMQDGCIGCRPDTHGCRWVHRIAAPPSGWARGLARLSG